MCDRSARRTRARRTLAPVACVISRCAGGGSAPFGLPPWRQLRSLFLSFCSCPRRSPAWGAVSAAVVCSFVLFRGCPRWARPAVGSWLALEARAVASWHYRCPSHPSRRFVLPPLAARRPFFPITRHKRVAALSDLGGSVKRRRLCLKVRRGRAEPPAC